MPANYIITEPAPSTVTYVRTGRGGAGNTRRITNNTPSALRPATVSHSVPASARRQPTRCFSGIGGAGNAHKAAEMPAVSLDEEFAHRVDSPPSVGHCGIGGAGNVFRRKGSDAGSCSSTGSSSDAKSLRSETDSAISGMSDKAKLWSKVSRTFSRD